MRARKCIMQREKQALYSTKCFKCSYLYNVVHREPKCNHKDKCIWKNQAHCDTGTRTGCRFPDTRSHLRKLDLLQEWILRYRNTRNHRQYSCTFHCHRYFVGTSIRYYQCNACHLHLIRIQRDTHTGRNHQCWYTRHRHRRLAWTDTRSSRSLCHLCLVPPDIAFWIPLYKKMYTKI